MEKLRLKLKLQYFGHLMQRVNSLEKTLMLGKIESTKEKGAAEDDIDITTDPMDMNLSKLWETVENREAWHAAVHGITKKHDLATEQQVFTKKKENTLSQKDLCTNTHSSIIHNNYSWKQLNRKRVINKFWYTLYNRTLRSNK